MSRKTWKILRYCALTMIIAAICLLLYCGGFYLKSYRENLAEKQKYEALLYLSRAAAEDDIQKEQTETGQQRDRAGLDETESQDSESAGKKDQMNNDETGEDQKKKNGKTKEQKGDKNGKNQKKTTKKAEDIRESFGISWEKLRKINEQIVGWIEVPGADISYPLVQGEDDEYYLEHSFEKKKDAFGCIFLGSENRKNFADSHSFIYGHNMVGNMMFANLNRYEKPEFLKQCPEFIITTPRKKSYYTIFSVEQARGGSISFEYGHELGSDQYKTQLEMLKQNSMYDTGVQPDSKKKMVTLITCNSRLDRDIRMAVHGICRKRESDSQAVFYPEDTQK